MMRSDTGTTFRLEDYKPTDYAIPAVDLSFRLGAETTRVRSILTVERRSGTAAGVPLQLDGDGLTLLSVKVDGKTIGQGGFVATADSLSIGDLPASQRFAVEIIVEINPAANKALMGLYRSGDIYCTQCEAEGFRRITYFLDRPDVLSVYSVRIEANAAEAPVLLSNGNRIGQGTLADGWHFAEWHDPHPKPSYLFALVAGDLGKINDEFVTRSGRKVILEIHVEHGKESRAAYAMDALKRSMRWDEENFGREYDLDLFMIVAVSSFNMGAMENKGLNIFNDKYVLADADTATDTDYAGIEAVIAHEYFHNWTGNRITCRDWFQLCLKEGLTVYRDHEFSADMRSRPVIRIHEVRGLKANQFPEDQGPLAHPVRPRKYREINNFYTATVYQKGSEVIRMLRTITGPAAFRAGMDLYFDRHDGQAVTIEDFIACFEEASGKDLAQFSLWYHQAGTPTVIANTEWNKAAQTFTLELEQAMKPTPGESRKRLMHIPVSFGLLGSSGKPLKASKVDGAGIAGDIIHLKKKHQTLVFHGIAERPVLSLNRSFSAPVNLAFEQRTEDRIFLAQHDGDLFTRWQALNTAAIEALIAGANQVRGGQQPDFDQKLVALFGKVAGDNQLEPAFRALALTLPLEGDIARETGRNVDPDAIFTARNALVLAAAKSAGAVLESAYENKSGNEAFNPDAASAGRRALHNIVLDYLSALTGDPALAFGHFNAATNMTDRHAALSVLCSRFGDSGETAKALAAFEQRHGHDPLVMDKWFAVQAMMPGTTALDRVIALTRHHAFSFENPNRMRALIGTFATSNQTGFNRADGAGYRFFADFIIGVDKANPQTAARILTAMRSWRSLEPGRKEKAREALASISSATGLSTDVRDIVDRTLA